MQQPSRDEITVDGVLRGSVVAAWLRHAARIEVDRLRVGGHVLTLALVRVGDDPASGVYVGGKHRACREVGVESRVIHLPATTSEAELLATIAALNADGEVDGVLVQLPLPSHIREAVVIRAVDPDKDVDGFHPENLGEMFSRRNLLEPCTPSGIMVLLRAAGETFQGREAVVVGRSVIVGRPMFDMLIRANATTTVCHRHSRNLAEHVGRAEILVVATGVPHLVKGAWVRPGAVVVDVGISRLPDGSLRGDVEFEVARTRASAITPVPGGVGPMTIAMLLWNTIRAGAARRGLQVALPEWLRSDPGRE